jgi:signal transduction histidine kinase
MSDDGIKELETKLKAQNKTIMVLSERLEQHISDNISGFALFEQNIALEHVVATRTHELETKHAELEQALEELKSAQSELLHAQKLQAIGQLASGIAHEINTPAQYVGDNIKFLNDAFNTLLQTIEFCRKTTPDIQEDEDLDFLTREIPRALKDSGEGMEYISNIVSAMKEFAHPSGETMRQVDLHSVIMSTVAISRNEWKHSAKLETDFDQQLPSVCGFKDELGQVMLNLIVNAVHAIEDCKTDNANGLIRISTQHDDDWAEIKVEDNGCGIPDELRQRIFEPFFTTKEVGRGSGQGLAIVYNVITDKHNGKLTVKSEQGKGSTFIIQLPLEHTCQCETLQ